jgi:hypothetical protein
VTCGNGRKHSASPVFADTEGDGGSTPPAPTVPAVTSLFVPHLALWWTEILGKEGSSVGRTLNCLTGGVSYARNLDLLDANASQLRELRQAIRPLARKLAARMAKRRRQRRRGRLDDRVRRVHPIAAARHEPGALQAPVVRVRRRPFAFVDGVDEVSKMLHEAGDVLDLQRLFTGAKVV